MGPPHQRVDWSQRLVVVLVLGLLGACFPVDVEIVGTLCDGAHPCGGELVCNSEGRCARKPGAQTVILPEEPMGLGGVFPTPWLNLRTRVVRVESAGIYVVVAGAEQAGQVDGVGTEARFSSLTALEPNSQTSPTLVFLGDTAAGAGLIRQWNVSTGEVSTLAGCANCDGLRYRDGVRDQARLGTPWDLFHSLSRNALFLSDHNHALRELNLATGELRTLVGAPPADARLQREGASAGDSDGSAIAARLNTPRGVAFDATRSLLYVADSGNHCIRKVDLTRPPSDPAYVTRIAGRNVGGGACTYGDGEGLQAGFCFPDGLAWDATTNSPFVADTSNNVIRRNDLGTNLVSTFSGRRTTPDALKSEDGDRDHATFARPGGLALDLAVRALMVTDRGTRKVRRVSLADGSVSTL